MATETHSMIVLTALLGVLTTIASSLIVYVSTRKNAETRMGEKLDAKEADLENEVQSATEELEKRMQFYQAQVQAEAERLRKENLKAYSEFQNALDSFRSGFVSNERCTLKHNEFSNCLGSVKKSIDALEERMNEIRTDIREVRKQGRTTQALLLATIQSTELDPKKRDQLMEQFQDVIKESG